MNPLFNLPFFRRTASAPDNDAPIREEARYQGTRNRAYHTRGGYENPGTGSGTAGDKMRMAQVIPTRISSREWFEVVGTELWQMRRLIKVVADDMVRRWRIFETDDDNELARVMEEQERKHRIRHKIRELIHIGRQYGTGILVMILGDAPLDEPLNITTMREGDLKNLILVDRYDLTVNQYIDDMRNPMFGKPEYYMWHAAQFGQHTIHHSRVLRYDAITLPGRHGYGSSSYDSEWGLSVIIQAVLEAFRDEDLAASVQAQMLRAGTLHVELEGLDQMMASDVLLGEGKSMDQVLSEFEQGVRSHRLIATEAGTSVEFLSPNLSGLAQLVGKSMERLAAAFDIPQTRLWGSTPSGLTNNDEAGLEHYSDNINTLQTSNLDPIMEILDPILLIDAGMFPKDQLMYEWVPFRRKDMKLEADTSKIKAEAITLLVDRRIMDEEEARASLDGDPLFGELPTDQWEPVPDPFAETEETKDEDYEEEDEEMEDGEEEEGEDSEDDEGEDSDDEGEDEEDEDDDEKDSKDDKDKGKKEDKSGDKDKDKKEEKEDEDEDEDDEDQEDDDDEDEDKDADKDEDEKEEKDDEDEGEDDEGEDDEDDDEDEKKKKKK